MIYWDYDELRNVKYNFFTVQHGKIKLRECQNIITFDIETSNGFLRPDGVAVGFSHDIAKANPDFYAETTPISLMYVWQCAVEDVSGIRVFMGRTWNDFRKFLFELCSCVLLSAKRKNVKMSEPNRSRIISTLTKNNPFLRIHIHNLGFEFQHLRNVLEQNFSDFKSHQLVFARAERSPMKAQATVRNCKVIFTDTLVLTQKSLKAWGRDAKLPVQKLDEPKDYYLPIRTPKTPLTDEEIRYSENDVVTMVYGLKEYRKKYITMDNVPLTQTGEVRRSCVEKIAKKNPVWSQDCINVTNSMSFDFYKMLRDAFVGGWTHGNRRYIGKVKYDVKCFDFRSSYPAVMCTRKFPLGIFEDCTIAEMETIAKTPVNDRDYVFIVKMKVYNLECRGYNSFWSLSKCEAVKNEVVDNGKIYSADEITLTMTDLDYDVFCKVYEFSHIDYITIKKSKCDYLPAEMINVILDYYNYKTSLKDVKGRESEYTESKQFINSIYGVCVTRILMDTIIFKNGWDKAEATEDDFYKEISNMVKKPMFTTYQIGVWVTAWARHNLWDGILKFDDVVIYGDTDSLKGLFDDKALKWFDDYNEGILELAKRVCKTRGIDIKKYTPQTPGGKVKELGFFDREHDCEKFKTLGAKRYCVLSGGEIGVTVAGLPKSAGQKITSVDDFTTGVKWDTKESEKLTSHYNDNQPPALWIDRDGNQYYSTDKYGLCLEPTTFDMSMSEDFVAFLELTSGSQFDPFFNHAKILRK